MTTTPLSSLLRDPRRLRRVVQRVLTAMVVLVLVFGLMRFGLVSVPAGSDAMTPSLPTTGARLVIDRYHEQARPLRLLDIVVYRAGGESLVGRLRARDGARLGRDADGMLTIDGEATAFALRPADRLQLGVVPEGHLLVPNENPDSASPDGRQLGLIARAQLAGRIVAIVPAMGG